jgi:hypothetical protein
MARRVFGAAPIRRAAPRRAKLLDAGSDVLPNAALVDDRGGGCWAARSAGQRALFRLAPQRVVQQSLGHSHAGGVFVHGRLRIGRSIPIIRRSSLVLARLPRRAEVVVYQPDNAFDPLRNFDFVVRSWAR